MRQTEEIKQDTIRCSDPSASYSVRALEAFQRLSEEDQITYLVRLRAAAGRQAPGPALPEVSA